MNIKYLKRTALLIVIAMLSFSMCKTSDLRTLELKTSGITPENTARGKVILKEALTAMNIEAWAKHPTYELIGSDTWYPQMGMNINPWKGKSGDLMHFRYVFNTFDSQVEWLEGTMKGEIYGMQSWQLYHQTPDGKREKIGADKKLNFLLPTMQYFNELLNRLFHAPIIAYMGEETINGTLYDRVFTTWDSPIPNKNDQYILYINRQNKRVERTTYTIRDNFMPAPKRFYGTAYYSDFRLVDSVLIPFKMDVFPFSNSEKMKVHTFQIKEFRFGAFAKEVLYPFSDLKPVGDAK